MIADEITSALDVSTQRAVAETLVEFRDRGFVKSLIFVTHDIGVLAQVADTILVMYAGKLAEKAPAEEIVSNPRHPYTRMLVSALPEVGVRYAGAAADRNPGPAAGAARSADRMPLPRPVPARHRALRRGAALGGGGRQRHRVLGGDACAHRLCARARGGPMTLRLDNVSKTYRVGSFGRGRLTAVRDVSFEVREGEVFSLIGESGSGKSTIGRMILRLLQPTAGSITYGGTDIVGLHRSALKEYYRTVQGVFQDPFSSFNPIFKADRIFGMVHTEFFPEVSGDEWRQRLDGALESVSLNPGDVLHKYPHQLSGGQLQRLLVARALLLDIRYLVADEIISMLDASTRIDVLNLLGDLKARGLGILFITHDLSLGNYISDQTVILRHGSIVEMGETEKVFGDPRHPYTQMLLASVPRLHAKWKDGTRPRDLPEQADVPALVEIESGHLAAL